MKSIQIFRKPVDKASKGDRCGLCLTNFDASRFERGLVCMPGFVRTAYAVLIELNKIKHYKGLIESGAHFHISIGHETLIGKIELFAKRSSVSNANNSEMISALTLQQFDFNSEYLYMNQYTSSDDEITKTKQIEKFYALIDFTHDTTSNTNEHGVLCVPNCLLVNRLNAILEV